MAETKIIDDLKEEVKENEKETKITQSKKQIGKSIVIALGVIIIGGTMFYFSEIKDIYLNITSKSVNNIREIDSTKISDGNALYIKRTRKTF